MRTLIALLTTVGIAAAQQTIAPTAEPVGSTRGDNVGGYNIVNSFETGYRWSLIDGNLEQYRGDVNYRNGLRLLGSSLAVHSRDGHGRFFDEISLTTQGLGNDPYESAVLRAQKNGLYRYDSIWRMNEYYNPGLVPSGGLHRMDTRRRLQDHDLTLLPQSPIRFRLGYSRNSQTGPALSSLNAFDTSRGDEFPLFTDVRRLFNEYRAAVDADVKKFRLTIQHRWHDFKEDTPYSLAGSGAGANPADLTALTAFRRDEPYHGTSHGWLGQLQTDRRRWAMNARITYTGGERGYVLDESAIGFDRFGEARNRQVLVTGQARRPVTTGDFSLSFFPTSKLSVVNSTAVHSTRIDGDSIYREYNNRTFDFATIDFRYLGIRTVSNTTQATYRANKWATFFARYGYSDRLIKTVEGFGDPSSALDTQAYENENRLHTGGAGVRVRPIKPVTVSLDGEIGRADNPLTPIAERNYHTLGARVDYRTRKLQLSGQYRQVYNINSPLPLSTHSAHSRNYTGAASWLARDWFSLDASYMKMHLDTASGLAFFAGSPRPTLQRGLTSLYASNIHAATLSTHFTVRGRVDLYAGYSVTRDTGDGRAQAAPASVTDPAAAVFSAVQTFPLAFHSPMARVSLRLTPKLRWNAGWQFYRYREDFGVLAVKPDYRAHTGYASLLWSF